MFEYVPIMADIVASLMGRHIAEYI